MGPYLFVTGSEVPMTWMNTVLSHGNQSEQTSHYCRKSSFYGMSRMGQSADTGHCSVDVKGREEERNECWQVRHFFWGVIQLSSKIDCGDSCDYSKNIKLCSLKG